MTANTTWNIANFRLPLVQSLLEDGHEITVLAPLDDTAADLRRLGCRHVPLDMDAKGLSPLGGWRLHREMARQFQSLRPDAVLSFTIKNNLFGAMAAKRLGMPFIPNVTGLGTAFLSGRVLQMVAETLYWRAFRGLPVVFFQNRDDQSLFLSQGLVTTAQARLLPGSGVDLSHFPATSQPVGQAPVFLMIARLIRDKGVLEYAQAASIVKRDYPGAVFQILGPTGAQNRSAIPPEVVAGWSPDRNLTYLGETDDVRPFIAKADCVVLPSYREGAPRTLIEAAAMARPVIATDVPGCRAVVDDGVTGFLCPPRDAGGLARACKRFLDLGQGQRRALGQSGRLKMEQEFDQALVVAAYRRALSEIGGE
ncbi:glycosyltransferase family 4 protein [Thalassovita sp.]|uniref:glycosyltransferase family 4 protein n=1 Tax=Thalassovita sp. TaxID=1979401 RepID=UPI0029DE8A08|nr:glycosyltransferase family 4 protein [Thalassovita sp.]